MKPRIKFGQVPGDVGKAIKIAMLEGRWPERARSRSFKREVRMRERAVLRERARREAEEEL